MLPDNIKVLEVDYAMEEKSAFNSSPELDPVLYKNLDGILCNLINSCGGAKPSQQKMLNYEKKIIALVRLLS